MLLISHQAATNSWPYDAWLLFAAANKSTACVYKKMLQDPGFTVNAAILQSFFWQIIPGFTKSLHRHGKDYSNYTGVSNQVSLQ